MLHIDPAFIISSCAPPRTTSATDGSSDVVLVSLPDASEVFHMVPELISSDCSELVRLLRVTSSRPKDVLVELSPLQIVNRSSDRCELLPTVVRAVTGDPRDELDRNDDTASERCEGLRDGGRCDEY